MTVWIARQALEMARTHLEGAGAFGREGTGMLAGTIQGVDRRIERFFAPDQRAGVYPTCWVEVTRLGKQQLALDLRPDERWLARIHSHPGAGFHSKTDDANPGLTAEGALSIVVPFFGLALRHGLEACALHEFHDGSWLSRNLAEIGIELA